MFSIASSNVDILSSDKVSEQKLVIRGMEVQPHVIGLQEVKAKNFRPEKSLVEL